MSMIDQFMVVVHEACSYSVEFRYGCLDSAAAILKGYFVDLLACCPTSMYHDDRKGPFHFLLERRLL